MDLLREYIRHKFDVQDDEMLGEIASILDAHQGTIEDWMLRRARDGHPEYPDEVDEQIRHMLIRRHLDDDAFLDQWYKEGW
jgi:hypothetical protein